jgi:hypothetical protein
MGVPPCQRLAALDCERWRATPLASLSSRNPFASHVAEGNCVRVPLGDLLQLVLVVHNDCADGVAGVLGFILEATRRMILLPRRRILGSAISPPRASPAELL